MGPLTDVGRHIEYRVALVSQSMPVIHNAKASSITNFSHSLILCSICRTAVRGRGVVPGTGARTN